MHEIYLKSSEIAEILGVSYRTIENWAKRKIIIQNDRNKYGLISCLIHKIEDYKTEIDSYKQQLEDLKGDSPEMSKIKLYVQKLAAEVRKENAIADIKELERDQLKEKLVLAEEVLIEWAGLITNARAKFLAIPARMALEIAGIDSPEKIQARLTEVIDEALSELGD